MELQQKRITFLVRLFFFQICRKLSKLCIDIFFSDCLCLSLNYLSYTFQATLQPLEKSISQEQILLPIHNIWVVPIYQIFPA